MSLIYPNIEALAEALQTTDSVAIVNAALSGSGFLFDTCCHIGSMSAMPIDPEQVTVYATPGWEGCAGVCVQVITASGECPEHMCSEFALPELSVEAYAAALREKVDQVVAALSAK